MKWLALASAFLLASTTQAQFVVVNKMPKFEVVNHCPAPAVIRIPALTTRAPVGSHTHTCANGHTWDHVANPTHTCQFCGLTQYVQDRSPRMVTVRTTSSTVAAPRTAPQQYHEVMQMFQGGCPSGNCPNARR